MKFAIIALLLAVSSISHAEEFKLFTCSLVGPIEGFDGLKGVIAHQNYDARNQAEAELKMTIIELGVNAKGEVVTMRKDKPTDQIVTSVSCVEMR